MTTRDLTHLYSLVLTHGDERRAFHFDEYERLMETRARLAMDHPDIRVEETEGAEFLFESADAVLAFVSAWTVGTAPPARRRHGTPVEESVSNGHAATPAARSGTKADQIIEMLHRKNGATAEEIAERFGIKKASATARVSVEARKRGLDVKLEKGRYRIAA